MTMGITTVLAYVISRQVWGWSRLAAGAAASTFIVADLAFFGANALKIAHGGWVPLVIALIGVPDHDDVEARAARSSASGCARGLPVRRVPEGHHGAPAAPRARAPPSS